MHVFYSVLVYSNYIDNWLKLKQVSNFTDMNIQITKYSKNLFIKEFVYGKNTYI